MKKTKLKNNSNKVAKTVSALIVLFLISMSFIPLIDTGISEENNSDRSSSVEISTTSNNGEIQISYTILGYITETIDHDGKEYMRYLISDESDLHQQGCPDVPTIRRSIIIPDDKKMKVDIVSKEITEYTGIDIIPSKGILPRTVNPDDIPYKFDEIYDQDKWYPENLVELDVPYILRDYRGQVVQINPVQYNPAQHKIRVINNIEVLISENGPGEVNVFERLNPLDRIDVEFNAIYNNHFLNYNMVASSSKYTPLSDQGNMLIICYDDFYDEMNPFVNWKNMKGIPTEIVNVSSIGSGTASDIDSHIENYYNTIGLTFVLLVGDSDQIPTLYSSGGASDPSYTYITADSYPDLIIGRFSAETSSQVQTQVERSIEYEKTPQISADWYHKGLGVASNQGPGDEGEYDDEHIDNIRAKLLNFTYTEVDQSYDPWGTSTMIADAVNSGVSVINYCGHGSTTSWSNGGGFSNSDVNALVNDNMLPFVWSVACSSGNFDGQTCFAETWLRATNNGEPTGGIGHFASTIGQNWDEPMDAQDEFNDILVELYINNVRRTYGGLAFNGVMHMLDNYPSAGINEAETWTIFGDPSIEVRTDTPTAMIVDHSPTIMSGETEFEVTVTGIEDALCAISYNGELLGYDYTDASGEALIVFDEPIEDIDELDLVVTAFNKIPYITTLVVTPPLRNIAEFDPMQGVLIAYPFGLSYDIIAEMSEEVIVITIVANAGEQSYVESQYATNGVNTANCEYLIAPSDSHWTRDYGPWFRYNASINEIEVIDFEYNRPRPNDDDIPNVFASEYGLTSVYMDIVHTGGNYMTDGQGISVSTDLVLSENPSMTEEQVQDMFSEYLGIQTYHLYPDPLGEYIEHIDCWGKFLSTDTIMIIEVDETHSNHDDIEAAATYFSGQISSEGTPYSVVRVYTHLDEPYINSLILNDKMLVPITGSSYDTAALQAYEDAMPGYEVLGFTGSWQNTDALHCRAKGIPDLDMIDIDHDELIDQMPNDAGFEVTSDMLSYAASKAIISPTLHWKNTSVGVWNTAPMSADEDTYTAFIPNHPCGEILYYYISAENTNGDVFKDPFIGADDPYSFDITLVPDIWVSPDSINMWGNEGQILSDILTIGNDPFAGEDLDFTIDCSDNSGYGWLSVNIDNGAIAPDTSLDITVYANTTGLSVGVYEEILSINSDDPDTPLSSIPVTIDVVYGDNVGAVSVNYPTGSIPDGSYFINATVQNFGSNSQTNVLVNCSIFEGGIGGGILIEDFSTEPVDWTITNIEGTAWAWDSTDERMENTYSGSPSGYLDSPVLDCSGKTGINLSFWHYWKADWSSGNQDGYVRGSIDGGASFPYVIDEFHHNDPAVEDAVKSYDISSWANNQAQVMIRFDINNDNDWYWYIDDFNVTAEITGPLVYSSEATVDIPSYDTSYVEFTPQWTTYVGTYGIQVTTLLPGDQNNDNNDTAEVVFVEGPQLSYDPSSFNFGVLVQNDTDSTSFEIWNSGVGTLNYILSETCSWVEVSPLLGDSTSEHDTIDVDVNTTGLSPGPYHCDITITSNGGNDVFGVDLTVVTSSTELIDINQSVFDRGFPVRAALGGNWGAAQNFTPTLSTLTSVDIYLRKFGTPDFDLVVELREDAIDGALLDTITFTPGDIAGSWNYVNVDFDDVTVTPGTDYFIKLPSGTGSNSYGYEWGYCFGNVYDPGAFWFTRDGGGLWRDLPTMYDFTFRTYGLI